MKNILFVEKKKKNRFSYRTALVKSEIDELDMKSITFFFPFDFRIQSFRELMQFEFLILI